MTKATGMNPCHVATQAPSPRSTAAFLANSFSVCRAQPISEEIDTIAVLQISAIPTVDCGAWNAEFDLSFDQTNGAFECQCAKVSIPDDAKQGSHCAGYDLHLAAPTIGFVIRQFWTANVHCLGLVMLVRGNGRRLWHQARSVVAGETRDPPRMSIARQALPVSRSLASGQ